MRQIACLVVKKGLWPGIFFLVRFPVRGTTVEPNALGISKEKTVKSE